MGTDAPGAVDVVRAYAAAWAAGTPEVAWGYYADHVVMRLPGRGALAGEHRGRAAVIGAITALLARTDGHAVTVDVLDLLASDSRVAVVVREVTSRAGAIVDLRRVNLYEVVGGRITAIDVYEANQYEVDEFFG